MDGSGVVQQAFLIDHLQNFRRSLQQRTEDQCRFSRKGGRRKNIQIYPFTSSKKIVGLWNATNAFMWEM
jgi:hypothetical protein